MLDAGEPSWKILARNLGENVEDVEQRALGEGIFSKKTKISESWFWGAKRYSPSRLTMAVSDLTLALWSILAVGTALVDVPHPITLLRIALLMLTLIYAAGILVWCKSEAQQPLNIKDAWTQFSEAIFKWKAAVKLIFRSGDTPDAPCSSARPPVLVLRLRLGSARPILRRPKASDDEGDGMLTRIDRAILRGADAARLAAALIPGSLLLLTSP